MSYLLAKIVFASAIFFNNHCSLVYIDRRAFTIDLTEPYARRVPFARAKISSDFCFSEEQFQPSRGKYAKLAPIFGGVCDDSKSCRYGIRWLGLIPSLLIR